ncbi:MAG: hypothetical protein ACYDGN_01560 [Acidimicrobiales bacterium]
MTGRCVGPGGGYDLAPIRTEERLHSYAARALERWAHFPIHAHPRPTVLLEGAAMANDGFVTEDAKRAFLTGCAIAVEGVPDEVVAVMRVPQTQASGAQSALRVIGATLSAAPFATDRGRRMLPAWRVDATGVRGPIWVLTANGMAHCWMPSTPNHAGPHLLRSGILGPRETDLTVEFIGGTEMFFDYESEVIEELAAVAVIPVRRGGTMLLARTPLTLEGHSRRLQVELKEPLRDRVLVNLDGSAVAVVTESEQR